MIKSTDSVKNESNVKRKHRRIKRSKKKVKKIKIEEDLIENKVDVIEIAKIDEVKNDVSEIDDPETLICTGSLNEDSDDNDNVTRIKKRSKKECYPRKYLILKWGVCYNLRQF